MRGFAPHGHWRTLTFLGALLGAMVEVDVEAACGPLHGRVEEREAHRWGSTRGRIGFHGGKVAFEHPRVRTVYGWEMALPSWDRAMKEDWLGRWAMNLMLINASTRRFGRAVRLPEGDVPAGHGSRVSKSATSRSFVALSTEKFEPSARRHVRHSRPRLSRCFATPSRCRRKPNRGDRHRARPARLP